MATALENAQASVAELVQLVPITVAKLHDLRAAAQPAAAVASDAAAVQALADAINSQVIAPLAAATADPAPQPTA